MAGPAWLVLACLWGASPQGDEPPEAPSSRAVPAPVEAPLSPGAPERRTVEGSSSSAGSAEQATLDPWASVPVQIVVPDPQSPPAEPETTRALLDPWAGAGRRNAAPPVDPELRDPFRGMRLRHDGPRLAHADLRDPFSRSSSSRPAPRSSAARHEPAASEPAMPLHPDLRDPFGRRKARPAPPSYRWWPFRFR